MKKLFLTLLISLTAIILLPASTFAAKSITDVSGTVTYNGSPISGASITITCGSKSKNTKSASDGTYLVQFNAKDCPTGSNVSVSADKSVGKGKNKHQVNGANSGRVNSAGSDRINVAIVDITLVPEFGMATVTGAAILGGGSMLFIRRRSLSSKA